ncbi:MAG: DUF4902 domain-containing protein [Burkholderiaceae bacterium]
MLLEEHEAVSAVPDDGFLRIVLDELLSVRLTHLVSGLDDHEPPGRHRCGTRTSIMGYTEWAGQGDGALISLGWDWRLELQRGGGVGCVRVGLPRSNVMLVDSVNRDYGWDRNLEALAGVVDAIPWSGATRRAIHFV